MSLDIICKAYSNPERIAMILCLAHEATVSELLQKCHLSQSALSQHLAVLRHTGIVATRREGRNVYYKTASSSYLELAEMMIHLTQ